MNLRLILFYFRAQDNGMGISEGDKHYTEPKEALRHKL